MWLSQHLPALTGGVKRITVLWALFIEWVECAVWTTPWILALELFAVDWTPLVERVFLAVRWASRVFSSEPFAVRRTLRVEGVLGAGAPWVLANEFFTVGRTV